MACTSPEFSITALKLCSELFFQAMLTATIFLKLKSINFGNFEGLPNLLDFYGSN
jgi:hypothetical protein